MAVSAEFMGHAHPRGRQVLARGPQVGGATSDAIIATGAFSRVAAATTCRQ
jgi:hypothetical protein